MKNKSLLKTQTGYSFGEVHIQQLTKKLRSSYKVLFLTGAIILLSCMSLSVSAITVTDFGSFKAELQKTTAQTIDVSTNITMTENIVVGAKHTVNIATNMTVHTGNYKITINAGTGLTINGGTLDLEYTVNDTDVPLGVYDGGELTINNVVNVKSTGGSNGIFIGNNCKLTVNGTINVQCNGLCNGLSFNSGGQLIMKGTIKLQNTGGGFGFVFFGILSSDNANGKFILFKDATIWRPSGLFNDRGTTTTVDGGLTIGPANTPAYAMGLAAGTYTWNGTTFASTGGTSIDNINAAFVPEIEQKNNSISVKGISKTAQLKLVGLNGQNLLSKEVIDNEVISIISLPKGIYIVYLQIEDKTVIKKIVK